MNCAGVNVGVAAGACQASSKIVTNNERSAGVKSGTFASRSFAALLFSSAVADGLNGEGFWANAAW